MIQARIWDLFGAAPIHQAPDVFDQPTLSDEDALNELIEQMKKERACVRAANEGQPERIVLHKMHDLQVQRGIPQMGEALQTQAQTLSDDSGTQREAAGNGKNITATFHCKATC